MDDKLLMKIYTPCKFPHIPEIHYYGGTCALAQQFMHVHHHDLETIIHNMIYAYQRIELYLIIGFLEIL